MRDEVLQRLKEEVSILHTIRRKASWICHILCRNCPLKHAIEGKIEERVEVMRRR
jgi:replicative superfamily II helicase